MVRNTGAAWARWSRASAPGPVKVPAVRQTTDWDCGPAALEAALRALGVQADQADIIELAGTGPAGTSPEQLAGVAADFGAHAEVVDGATLQDLAERLAGGQVAILGLQAPAEPLDGDDRSHYVVASAVDEAGNVTVMDPWIGESYALAPDEIEARWRVAEGAMYRTGLAVFVRAQPAAA